MHKGIKKYQNQLNIKWYIDYGTSSEYGPTRLVFLNQNQSNRNSQSVKVDLTTGALTPELPFAIYENPYI